MSRSLRLDHRIEHLEQAFQAGVVVARVRAVPFAVVGPVGARPLGVVGVDHHLAVLRRALAVPRASGRTARSSSGGPPQRTSSGRPAGFLLRILMVSRDAAPAESGSARSGLRPRAGRAGRSKSAPRPRRTAGTAVPRSRSRRNRSSPMNSSATSAVRTSVTTSSRPAMTPRLRRTRAAGSCRPTSSQTALSARKTAGTQSAQVVDRGRELERARHGGQVEVRPSWHRAGRPTRLQQPGQQLGDQRDPSLPAHGGVVAARRRPPSRAPARRG